MKRVLLVVAYDGTNYHGWQVQPSAVTIESELNRAIQELTGEDIAVIGASRTDAGVHAMGNVAVFDTESNIPGEKFSYALNQRLPDDIVIQHSSEVDMCFHPRHCDCVKTYEYRILNRRFPLPEYRNTSYFYYGNLDVDAMRTAAAFFVGEHDFAGFCSAGAQVKTTVRTVFELEILESVQDIAALGRMLTIRITGNGFLYNMVRIIAGTLIEVGKGNIPAEQTADIIAACDRKRSGPTAPARGLHLTEIRYNVKI